jgi:hypothetical protein
VFAGYRGDVIQAIKIGKGLTVSLVFDQFFGAAVEETDMGVQIPHKLQVERSNEVVKLSLVPTYFAVKFCYHSETTVSCWVTRTEIYHHVCNFSFFWREFFGVVRTSFQFRGEVVGVHHDALELIHPFCVRVPRFVPSNVDILQFRNHSSQNSDVRHCFQN